MKNRVSRNLLSSRTGCLAGCLLSLVAVADSGIKSTQPASPQALSNPSISRWVVASGGGLAGNGGYELRGAIGQPVAATSTGGVYELKSGYHSEDDLIFRNDLDQ